MKINLLKAARGRERVHWFHCEMYHGSCESRFEFNRPTFAERRNTSEPLRMVRNGWRVPDFFLPIGRVVVSARLREALSAIGAFPFRPVEFVKLIEVPYRAGDLNYTPSWHPPHKIFHPETLYEKCPDVPRLHQAIGSYYELILPRIREVGPQWNAEGPTTLLTVPWVAYSDTNNEVSRALMTAYPILDAGYLILTEAAFAVILPYLDWDYFECIEVEI